VRRVRRLAFLALGAALATASLLAVGITPAAAHICPIAALILVDQPATIDVGVTVENATVPDVEIDVPSGLLLNRVDAKPGWTVTRKGSTLRYRGGPIERFTCEYFSLGVTAPARGSFGIPVVQRTADGTVVARTTPDPSNATDRILDQFVYAGVKPPSNGGGAGGPSATTIAGIALVAVGVIAAGARLARTRWMPRYEEEEEEEEEDGDGDDEHGDGSGANVREDELRARLAQFKARTPGPPTGL